MQLDQFLSKLSGVKRAGSYHTAKCPAHEDKQNSLKISKQASGKITLKCFAGCDIQAICSSMGVAVKDLYPADQSKPKTTKETKQNDNPIKKRTVVKEYLYRDKESKVTFKKIRYLLEFKDGSKDKSFVFQHWNETKFVTGIGEAQQVIYNLPDVLESERVFLVEGEKDADNLSEHGFTATTNSEGAATWRESYNEAFTGKDVVICIDHDIAGHNRLEKLKENLTDVKSLRVWNPFAAEPILQKKGKDVSDWIDSRIDAEKTTAEIQAEILEIIEKLPFEKIEKPKPNDTFLRDFRLKDEGLFHITFEYVDREQKERETWICTPITLESWTRDKNSGNWGRFCSFKDSDFKDHRIVVPVQSLQGDGAECINLLSEQGLLISRKHKAKLLDYLLLADNGKRATCVITQGWHDGAFVLPDRTFSETKQELILQNTDTISSKFKAAGTLEEWQENISKYAVGNSRLIFGISLAFASALLPLANEPNGGFHLRGDTSTGKSTALYVAGSVWGGDNQKGFLETWKATANGFEIVAQNHNHALLLLDEIKQVNAKEVGDIIYTLANGFGKSRMTKTIQSRAKMEWNLLFLSSGEMSLSHLLAQTQDRIFGGQEARFVDIEAKPPKGFGLFDTLHDFANGSDFSTFLRAASCKYYGTGIRSFLENVITRKAEIEKYIVEVQQDFSKKVFDIDNNAAGEISRVAMRFAIVAAAGELATAYGVTKWQPGEALRVSELLFDDWLDRRGGTGNFDLQQGIEQVISFIQSNQHRFADAEFEDSVKTVRDLIGFRDKKIYGETVFFLFPSSFKNILCKGFDYKQIGEALREKGYLIGSKDMLYKKQRVKAWRDGKPDNFYCISLSSEFSLENSESSPE